MELNFICRSCRREYDFEVGKVTLDEEGNGHLEIEPHCPYCKDKKWELSEYGQSQATELDLADL